MKKLCLLLLLLSLSFVVGCKKEAQDSLEYVKEKGVLTIGVLIFLPWDILIMAKQSALILI
jgi:hypothetical protein